MAASLKAIEVKPIVIKVPPKFERTDDPTASNVGGAIGGADSHTGVEADDRGWPDEATEDAMRAEIENREGGVGGAEAAIAAARGARDEAPVDTGPPLPSVDTVVGRIPAKVRETLDELFRARFDVVRRVPESALKSESAEKSD